MDEKNVLTINKQVQIPLSELRFRFSGSSGPGGQHVNKTATKVTLLFDVRHSPSLTETQRQLILQKLANRIDKEGVLRVEAQTFRSQRRNRDTAVAKFCQLLAQALKKPKKRQKTRPGRAAQEKRLAAKKKQSEKKRQRRQNW